MAALITDMFVGFGKITTSSFTVLLCKNTNKYEKHFPKMLGDVGMAVPKSTETRCRDSSLQAGYEKTTQATPSLHLLLLHVDTHSNLIAKLTE